MRLSKLAFDGNTEGVQAGFFGASESDQSLVFLLSRLNFDPFKDFHAGFVQSPEQQQHSI